MSKKIIFTVTNDLTHDQRMIRICSSLSKAGFDVLLVGRTRSFSTSFVDRPFRQKRLSCIFNKGKLFYLEYNIRLFFFLFFQKIDIICAIDLDTILPCFYISKFRNKAMVYDAHEYFTEVPEVVQRAKVKAVWEKIARKTIPNIQYNYTVGKCLAEIFEKEYQQKFEVIRNLPFASNENDGHILPPDVQQQFDQAKSTGTKILLYQGALNDGRGIEEVIHVMEEVDAVLWLVGEGDLSEMLRAMVDEKGLESKVIFLGMRTPEELKAITPLADIGLNLLQNKGLSYYYSLANKAFDYIQASIPAIHMDFPEYQALNGEHEVAVLIKDLSKENLLEGIHALLENEELYLRLKNNCTAAGLDFTWEKEGEKLVGFYQKITV